MEVRSDFVADKDDIKDSEVSEEKTVVADRDESSDTDKVVQDDSDEAKKNNEADSELQSQLDEINDKYMRAQAEIVNMQRRNEKEQANLVKYDGQKLAKSILPVMDNLERALLIEVTDENGTQLKKGIEMVQNHLANALTENGIKEIGTVGSIFDPNEEQAVQTVEKSKEYATDTVVQVLQKGYKLKDRVLRPAMVVVAQ
ncbi:nucleotide exchange factor GrpE [Pediococcus claussenii]|uniref:Protein GrpE n=1 Tax=Pediococcus claussenii (strain ATCC BAA-344 / DSM 14800 / JCM 18046 / KCTC 3811 / LMG 21948 / P06) TaxID=701521 RepID=G8PDA8_PEDCP|nr:protein grpE [Pediococcus claussenii ATCC BAA-344]ANZ70472.1 nucleotide exchange factor GrpE [Pediococcus claussenii]ANZ72287.1 nucleotide exchange factor GrpE [Pediococcus claussenii]KRN19575.1 grpE protein [Pediococcus claussenii]